MNKQNPRLSEKIRDYFNKKPYPTNNPELFPDYNLTSLYLHSLVTPYYLRYQKVIQTEGKLILDAGCGSGYKSLTLAKANPGAKIIGIDISEVSIDLARKRLENQGIKSAEFYVLSMENISQLGYQFDYINIDEVLYLFEDMVGVLESLKSVLKPQGIIRANVHSALQRAYYFQAQEMCQILGLCEHTPGESEVQKIREVMEGLKNEAIVKRTTWNPLLQEDDLAIITEYFPPVDQGYTIPELFEVLRQTDLQLISMCNWRYWEVTDLFEDAHNLPLFLEMGLAAISLEERLHLFELLQPIHQLLDFWCGHQAEMDFPIPVSDWSDEDWQKVTVYLHPQLRVSQVKEDLQRAIRQHQPFEMSRYIPLPSLTPIMIDSHQAACLLPLWEGEQPMGQLVERWLQLSPVDPFSLTPLPLDRAWVEVKELVKTLESFLYLLLER